MEQRKLNLIYILTLPILAAFVIWSHYRDLNELENDTREMYESQFEYKVLSKSKDYSNHGLISVQFFDLHRMDKINFEPTIVGLGVNFYNAINIGDTVVKLKSSNYFYIKNGELADTVYFNIVK